jgi:hypothetical protein
MKSTLRISVTGLLTVCFVFLGAVTGHSTTVERMNVEKLVQYSELILVGQVVSVTDGFDGNNIPYTQVTLQVGETLKGNVGGNYTFRQFGLMAPRAMPNGRVYVGVSPDGWPKFREGEQVMVFLHATTALGFQSSAGLLQGKFNIKGSQVFNEINNMGLFEGVSIDPGLLTEEEQKMLESTQGTYPEETFRGFVRKAVDQDWFQ